MRRLEWVVVRRGVWMIFWALFVASPVAIVSAPPVELGIEPGTTAVTQIALGRYMDIREDATGGLTIQDVLEPGHENLWIPNHADVPNFSFSRSTYWIRVRIENKGNASRDLLLEHAFPVYDYVDVYAVTQAGVAASYKTGDRRPFASRPIHHRNFLFPILLPAQSTTILLVRLATEDGLHESIPLTLWDKETFQSKEGTELFLLGAYIGIILIMAFYNLFIFVSVREKSYLYYVLYLLLYALWFVTYKGFSYQYFWPNNPWLANFAIPFSALSFTAVFLQFTRNFLNTSAIFPGGDRVLAGLIVFLSIWAGFAAFGKYSTTLLVFIPVMLFVTTPAIITCAVVTLLRRHAPSRYYMGAFLLFFLGAGLLYLKILSVLPANLLTENGVLLGSVAEVVLLSFGLANKINFERKEKVTAQRLALENEQRARQAQAIAITNLEKGNLAKDQFLANLSHELRTPLSVIYGYSEMFEFTSDAAAMREYGKDIHIQAGKLKGLVDDLMLITTIEADQPLSLVETDVALIAREVAQELAPLYAGRNIALHDDLQTPLMAKVDPLLFRKAIFHVIKNAFDYNQPGGSVWITTGQDTSHARITVRDSGIGIETEHLERIFERFYRVDKSNTYEVSGAGIGLFIAQRALKLQGGTISVQSRRSPPSGSEFTVLIPG